MTYMKLDSVQIWLFNNLGFHTFPDFIVNLQESERIGFDVVSTDQIKQAVGDDTFRKMECDVTSYINIETKPVTINYVQVLKDEYIKESLKFIKSLSIRDEAVVLSLHNLLLKFGVTREEILELQDKHLSYEK